MGLPAFPSRYVPSPLWFGARFAGGHWGVPASSTRLDPLTGYGGRGFHRRTGVAPPYYLPALSALQVGNRYTNIIYKVMISQFITFLSEGDFLAYKVKVVIDEVEFGMANIAFFVGIGFIAVLDLAIPHSYIAEESRIHDFKSSVNTSLTSRAKHANRKIHRFRHCHS